VLKVNYTTREFAQQTIKSEITAFYQTNYPEIDRAKPALVEQAGEEVANIYLRNIVPDMHLTWGTHPNNLGHNDSPDAFAATMATTPAQMAKRSRMTARRVTRSWPRVKNIPRS
jgi:hypothetical protein